MKHLVYDFRSIYMREVSIENKEHNLSNYDKVSMLSKSIPSYFLTTIGWLGCRI